MTEHVPFQGGELGILHGIVLNCCWACMAEVGRTTGTPLQPVKRSRVILRPYLAQSISISQSSMLSCLQNAELQWSLSTVLRPALWL